MKFIVSFLLTALLSFALGLYMPWWSIAIAAFVVAVFIQQRGWLAFLAGFLSLFLLWGIMSLMISNANNSIMAHKISMLFLKVDNPILLILVTALIGSIVAGFAGLTGSLARSIFAKT